MFEKEAFSLLTKRMWCMLDDNDPLRPWITEALDDREPRPFREDVARHALQNMTKNIGRTVEPNQDQTGDDFVEAVALAFAFFVAEYVEYVGGAETQHGVAERLIFAFCTSYVGYSAVADNDDATWRKVENLVNRPLTNDLREHVRGIDIARFGNCTLRPWAQHFYPSHS